MTPKQDTERILAKLRSLDREKAPSMTFDRCDAKTLLEYIEWLEGSYESEWGTIAGPSSWWEVSAGNSPQV